MLRVQSDDPDLQRKGRVLAIILLSLEATMIVLATVNLVQGATEHYFTNSVLISLIFGVYMLNRFGLTRIASLITVAMTATVPFLLINESLVGMYVAMIIPVLVASYLLVPWSGFVLAALMSVGAVISGTASLSLLFLALITILAYLFANSLDRAYRENRHRALHDELTGLPNRTLFVDRLQQALLYADRYGTLPMVMFMDLDQFKVVNDSLGHRVGDSLLNEIARRLKACLRSGDTAARLGGDEFTVLLNGLPDVNDAVRIAQRIIKAVEAPIDLEGRQIAISTSVGIAVCEGADAQPSTLLRNADVAMYEAKKEGKARCKVFSSDMHAQALRRLELEHELRQAIEHAELRIYYQPTVSLSTGRINGMEALVRWEHPERGLLLPEEFVPLAEETGLIIPLGRWALREVCHHAREWAKEYPVAFPLTMSVNMSVKQFQEPYLVHELTALLREKELDPRCLQLEITESVFVDDVEYATGLLGELGRVGIRLALDDFGTGYSSLAFLRRFSMDKIKIDKAFIHELGVSEQGTAIVRLVIDLAHALGMQACAEGVETAEHLARLRDMGCDEAQGFYFWKPLACEEVVALLADSPRRLLDHPYSSGYPLDPADDGRQYFRPK